MTFDPFDPFEQRLHSVLTREAERAPISTLTPAEVRRLDEQGQGRSPALTGHRVRWIAVAAAVVAGTGAGVLGLTGGGSTPAFASWVSEPQAISSAQVAGVDVSCSDSGPVIVDRRGNSAYAVYSNGTSWTDCLQTIPGQPHDKGLPEGWTSSGELSSVELGDPSATEPLTLLSAKAPEGNSGNRSPVTWVSGRYSAAVARITIATSDGTVIPTTRDGVYAAWWPGNDGATDVVRAYDQAGDLISSIDEWNCGTPAYPLTPRIQATGQAPVGGCS
jgi:hypothetical protein